MNIVYLSRRNLLTLLSKLDRAAGGDETKQTLIKYDVTHPLYPCSGVTAVVAVEDAEYYSERAPGGLHPSDETILQGHYNAN